MLEDIVAKKTAVEGTLEVDVSEFFETDKPVIFRYRTPSVADVYAVAQQHVLDTWRLKYPEIPREFAQTIEFIARLHLEPTSSKPIGEAYYELLTHKMDAYTAARFIAKVMSHIAPWARDLDNLLDEKKVPFGQEKQQ